MELIYCANGNKRFAEIARASGFRLGAQLPGTTYFPIWFADQDWKKPSRAAYMAALARHRPALATVLDLERAGQLGEVLSWAEEAAQYVEHVAIIPKYSGAVDALPRRIGGADVVLAFSVPTRYGGTEVPIWEFAGWPVHLLGGSPHAQMQYAAHLRAIAEVVSADGNMANKMATTRGQFWTNGDARWAKDRYWPKLSEAGWHGDNAPYEAFRRSCANIAAAWAAQ